MNNSWMDQPGSCEVRAHGQVIRYQCSGTGRPVILLRSEGPLAPSWGELLRELQRSYRMIVPEPPPPDSDVTGWLDAFLEGLGSSGVRILATDRFCLPAFELALGEGEQIARLVLMPEGPGREIVLGGSVEAALARARVPLLLVHESQPAAELNARVTSFLGAAGAALPARIA
jgi:hypothetical protein